MRKTLNHCRNLLRYVLGPRKTLVLVLCTMRSGSTLLKALLGEAPDVSHLPEVRFIGPVESDLDFYARFSGLAPERIVLLKHPLWFKNGIAQFTVPALDRIRLVGIVRDCYPTLCSIKAMPRDDIPADADLIDYWLDSTTQILARYREAGARGRCVRYEDLVANPVAETQALFEFMGSTMHHGVTQYSRPQHGEWEWGSDDGGPKIRSLEVTASTEPARDESLLALIDGDERVARLRKELGYPA